MALTRTFLALLFIICTSCQDHPMQRIMLGDTLEIICMESIQNFAAARHFKTWFAVQILIILYVTATSPYNRNLSVQVWSWRQKSECQSFRTQAANLFNNSLYSKWPMGGFVDCERGLRIWRWQHWALQMQRKYFFHRRMSGRLWISPDSMLLDIL